MHWFWIQHQFFLSKDISGGTRWKFVCKKVYHYLGLFRILHNNYPGIKDTHLHQSKYSLKVIWAIYYVVRNRFTGCKVMYNFWETVFGTWYQPCKASQPPTVILYAQSCQYPFCSGWNNCNSGCRQFIVVLYYAVMSSYYITILILCTFYYGK